ncbi:LamG domain-containing protein [bacterium]|nr:LamG domain-containing protein [bacterium]
MKNTKNFAAKTIIFALCAFFLFSAQLLAATASNDGCHKMNGCSTGDSYNVAPFNDPTYSPSWTEVTTTVRVHGGDYLRFSVVEGEIYQWSTEGKEDAFTGDYAKPCDSDNECAVSYELSSDTGLRCVDGYCLLPFDTELTLIDGNACSTTANFLAYSNSDGYRNQSQLEWKATFTGSVVLLVTNYEAQKTAGGAYTGEFKECQKTTGNQTTTVKWRRTSSEHCDVCGASSDFKLSGGNAAKADNVATAPSWTAIQEFGAANYTDADLDSWIKPGSYITFEVKENQIYRWSTCKSAIHDTQLTLFKGTVNNAGEEDACGDFLAYGDDSEVSYIENGNTYCPVGTKQTVLEWQSNFNGKVTLLFSEYNCYQCAPQKNPVTGDNNWLSCFDTTVGTYQATVNGDGSKTVVTDDDGFPVVASSSCNPAQADSPCVVASYIYTYPLHWQRYDCQGCEGMQSGAEIVDSDDESSDNFGDGGHIDLDSKKYASFSLKRGSKYLFKSNSSTSIITIRQGNGCGGKTLAQGTGQLAYFANSDDYDDDEGTFGPDLISVYISDSDCNPDGHTLTYSYYTESGDVKTRFKITKFGGDEVVTDNATQLQFADTGEWVDSWQKAINKCREYSVGGSEGNVLKCPERICPSPQSNYDDIAGGDFCRFKGAAIQCQPPVCSTNYSELQKKVSSTGTVLNQDESDYWGKCYYNGSVCDDTLTITTGIADGPNTPDQQCRKAVSESYYEGHLLKYRYYCPDGYVWTYKNELSSANFTFKYCCTCKSGYVLEADNKCYKYSTSTECKPADEQKCVGREVGCNEGIVSPGCPAGYTEQSDGRCLSNDEVGYNVYDDVVEKNPTSNNYYSADKRCPTSPLRTLEEDDGRCEYSNCYKYIYEGDIQQWGTYWVDKRVRTTGTTKYPLCRMQKNKNAQEGTCCATVNKYVFDDEGNLIEWIGAIPDSNFYYATATNPDGSVASAAQWKDPEKICPDGYNYVGSDGKCYKCKNGSLVWYDGEYHCYSCSSGEYFNGKCQTCNTGYTLGHTGGEGGTDPEYYCKRECPSEGYLITEGSTLKCYTNFADKVNKCTAEGWIQDPNNPDKCRKIQLSGGSPVNVDCVNGNLKDEGYGKHCDTSNPNSYDCDCSYNRCEDSSITLADAKICPTTYTERVVCGGTPYRPKYCNKTYTITTIPKTTILDGETVEVAGICSFTNSEGQTCGEAMGGWTLPNINQLYSIVDFDLYDPATAYPDLEYSRGVPNSETCSKTESTYATCNPEDSDPCHDDYMDCIGGRCVSIDPFGDLKCKADGSFLCIDNKCVRNNWFWSYNTVVSEKEDSAKFTWAVNMEDGRSYRALKGCVGEACAETVDTTARRHRVICVKGSTLSGIFDNDAPTLEQTFSGWACDKDDDEQSLAIYFEITDNSGSKKNVAAMLPASDYIMNIPGLGGSKGIKYGQTDIKPTSGSKANEIYNNCNFKSDPAPHAFEIKWNGDVTAGKEDLAALIMSIENVQCSDEKITAYYNAVNSGLNTFPDISDCALPPYFVTAYGVNEASTTATAIAIAPTERPFVITNICGDGYQTFDGDFRENCENDWFNRVCGYNNSSCELCAREEITKNGQLYEPCQKYPADPPKCGDSKIQSEYCENGVVTEGHEGAGLACEKYSFSTNNILSLSEQCDCGVGFYYYDDSVSVNCSHKLERSVCPEYNSSREFGKPTIEDDFCYICVGCQKTRTEKGYCGDGKIQRSDCTGDPNCEEVPGANEECDDGGAANVDTGSCKKDCTSAYCGDGFIQSALDEKCDSKDKNGHYETHCQSDEVKCPGCASVTCGIGGTDALGPRCGDGKIQNITLCTANASTLAANGYSSRDDFFEQNGFESVADCQAKLGGDNPAQEVCDLGVVEDDEGNVTVLNGRPITFEEFINTSAGADCYEEINGVKFPVNAIHEKFAECVYKYKQFVNDNPGCSADCKTAKAPYCGDIPVGESNPGDLATGENCDNGLPNVEYKNGKYTIAAGTANYNGKAYGSCRLDCKERYECNNEYIEKGEESCTGLTVDNYCPSIGSWSASEGYVIYVSGGWETCDEGGYNGTYGHCEGCKDIAKCGGEIPKINEIYPGKFEECDRGDGMEGNKPLDKAYSVEYGQSCVAEEGCDGEYTTWGDKRCCVFGRYCGDGTVDNGLNKQFENWVGKTVTTGGGSIITTYNPAAKWDLSGVTVEYDIHNYALLFTLTEDTTSENPATATFKESFDIDPSVRYLMELDLMLIPVADEEVAFDAGMREYNESGSELTEASSNPSPFYFVDINNPSGTYISGKWYHGRNSSPIKGLGTTSRNWAPETKTGKVILRMEGAEGTRFRVRAFSFYDIEHLSYKNANDTSEEMCDPGYDENGNSLFKDSSSSYMTDCQAGCKWINYCGDGVVQRMSGCENGKYNGYDCVNGIGGAEEICDKGSSNDISNNKANVYNGCEPGCVELGPRCGDGILDTTSCAEGSTNCNVPNSFDGADPELCDNGDDNNNTPRTGKLLDITSSNYGTCRTNCKPSRCGDGIWDKDAFTIDKVPLTDDDGNIIYETNPETGEFIYVNGNKVPKTKDVERYLEGCDCGAPGSYDMAVTGTYQTTLKDGTLFDICKDDSGNPVYNTNSEKRKAVCRPNCTVSRCGDGVLDKDANEECDDGNDNDHDSCKNDCTFNRCNDGVFAFTRSYLCEELVGMTTTQLQDMAKKGIVDCDGSHTYSCSALKDLLTTNAAVADKFDDGVLHCCYDTKLREGGEGDQNCKYPYADRLSMTTRYLSPKELAVQLCKDNAAASDVSDTWCSSAEQIERCEYCKDADCGCAEQYPNRATTERAAYEACLETNKYCIFDASSQKRCWNVFGSCGDGKIDTIAGEQCDNYVKGDSGTYFDLDGEERDGGSDGIGTYCTGLCSSGTCSNSSPRCTEEGQLNCWLSGCARKQHRNNNDITPGTSRCGDGLIDSYAIHEDSITHEITQLEECDDGADAHSDNSSEAYCSTTCKKNTIADGTYARCGDTVIQTSIEKCDDGNTEDGDYCTSDCKTSYGKCGDGEIHGEGFKLYDSLNPLESPNELSGPEYCDLKEEGGVLKGDARSLSLAKAGLTNFCNDCGVDLVPFTCGDKKRNQRFEGCDFGTGNNDGAIECSDAIKVSSNGTYQDFGLCTEKSLGTKCYSGCKSDAIGGLIQAVSFGVYGWACDPDHPMTHKDNFVILKFVDKDGTELEGSPVTLKTDWNFGENDEDLKGATDINGYAIDQNFTVKACGGGSKHGWFFNPSKATGVTFINGPYTVRAYARSLDSGEKTGGDTATDVTKMVFLGEASFVMSMSCGDRFTSKCSDITVRIKATNDDGTPTYKDISWEDNKVCVDSDLYDRPCSGYGLENGKACKSEKCDNGTNYNGSEYDCGSDCQWTKCGDSNVQSKAGTSYFSGYEFRPAANRAKPKDPEECEGSVTEGCDTVFKNKKPADGINNDLQSNETNCVAEKCKWNVNNVCKVQSDCPALSTAEMYVNNFGDGKLYKKEASTYIKYVNASGNNVPKYTRTWSGDFETGYWPTAETKVQHYSSSLTGAAATCAFECVDDLIWDGTKCVGRDGENGHGKLTHDCGTTACPDTVNGVWAGSTAGSPSSDQCYGGTTNPQIDYYTEIDGNGNIKAFHKNGNTKEYYSGSGPVAEYGSVANGKNCIYTCPTNSVYGSDKVCHIGGILHTCKTPANANTFTDNRVWVKVWKDENGHVKMEPLPESGEGAVLKIQRTLNSGCGNEGVECYYEPSETPDLDPIEVNDGEKGIIKQLNILGVYNEDDPDSTLKRCFYTCKSGYKMNDDGTACVSAVATEGAQCGGNTVIHSEHCDLITGTGMAGGRGCRFTPDAHELCEDKDNNGKYKTSGSTSYCKSDCGVSDEEAFLDCVENHPSDYKTACAAGQYGRIGAGKYSCGDGVVQYKSSETCFGVNCNMVTTENYPKADVSNFSESEQCDGADSRKNLCDRWLTMNNKPTSSSYYETTTSPGCTTACKLKDVSHNTCGFCGDGVVTSGKEACEATTEGIVFESDEVFDCKSETITSSGTAGTTYTYKTPVTGIYTITVKGARGGHGYHTQGNGGDGADGDGGSRAPGLVITAKYFIKAGQTLSYIFGGVGNGAASVGTRGYDAQTGGSGCHKGKDSSGGKEGHSSSYRSGAGGAGGGSSCVKIGTQTLIEAYGGGGGGGGKGGYWWYSDASAGDGASGSSGGSGGSGAGSYGADGGNGGNGGRYSDSSYSYYYPTTSGSDYYFVSGSYTTSTNDGSGSVTITLEKYAPCTDSCQFETNTSNFIAPNNKKIACTGLPVNAVWSSNNSTSKTITQSFSSGSWSPDNAGSYNTSTYADACYFKCASGYTYEDSQCINEKYVECTTKPTNSEWTYNNSNSQTIKQTWNGSGWTPSNTGSYNTTPDANQCRFKCKSGYTYEGGLCINKKTVSCGTIPSGAVPNTVSSITQNWTPSGGWQPAATWQYNTTGSTTECRYKCNTNYTWTDNSYCKADSHSADCSAKPANTDWNTVSSITQTWNGSSWQPSATSVYNTTASSTECRYKCINSFHTENSGVSCVSNTKTQNCGTLPANAEWNSVSSYQQNWTGSAWNPADSTLTHNDTASTTSCRFKCKTHYPWDSSSSTCKAETKTFTCSGKPANSVWTYTNSDTQTYTQTWNGSTFAPADSSASYGTSSSASTCKYKCNSGYDWKNNKCIKTHYSWGFESNLPGDWISQVSNTYWGRTSSGSYGLGNGLNSASLPGPKEGSYAMCSTNTGDYHGTVANLIVEVTIPSEYEKGTLSFSYTGTSEKNWDVFHVYLDPTQSDIDYNSNSCSNSATQIVCTYGSDHLTWNPVSISNLAPGKHRILFKYRKDGSVSTSADRYCIDNLTLDYVSCSDSLKSAPLYLKLNEGSGSTTANSGTAGGSYSISGGSWDSSGKRSKAYNFTGSTTVSTGISKYTNSFTMMAWVKVTSGYTITLDTGQYAGTSGQHYLFGANHEGGNAGAGLSVGTNGILATAHGDGYMPGLAVYSGDIGTGWRHVAVVFNNKTPSIYLDGVLVTTGSAASHGNVYSPTNIGSGSYGEFYGSVDDVRIIGSALSAEEVMAEYGKLATCSSL